MTPGISRTPRIPTSRNRDRHTIFSYAGTERPTDTQTRIPTSKKTNWHRNI